MGKVESQPDSRGPNPRCGGPTDDQPLGRRPNHAQPTPDARTRRRFRDALRRERTRPSQKCRSVARTAARHRDRRQLRGLQPHAPAPPGGRFPDLECSAEPAARSHITRRRRLRAHDAPARAAALPPAALGQPPRRQRRGRLGDRLGPRVDRVLARRPAAGAHRVLSLARGHAAAGPADPRPGYAHKPRHDAASSLPSTHRFQSSPTHRTAACQGQPHRPGGLTITLGGTP